MDVEAYRREEGERLFRYTFIVILFTVILDFTTYYIHNVDLKYPTKTCIIKLIKLIEHRPIRLRSGEWDEISLRGKSASKKRHLT